MAIPYKSIDMEVAEGLELGIVSMDISAINTVSGGIPRHRAHTFKIKKF